LRPEDIEPAASSAGFRFPGESTVFGIFAFAAFALGAVLHVSRTVTPIWLDSTTLLLAGLAFGMLHLLGIGVSWLRR
jgi:hypothetical protein